ncbi:NAD(P)-dependent oxidoreductase [Leptotrichia sp. oral taxon 847]|uniref:NAD(P)-dependent oxidoreductase n=1 Tax=Leptotrichia sp. oral taxon 847 TaxID=1785996 RepID=UPI000A439A4B|nr:NAD(P)-dependent oxidoreductase [Leptotrichia sp. oral taxon 847]
MENSQNEIEKIVKNYFLVITATDDADLNEKIALICDRNNILVNNVSSKTMMNTMFTGVVKNSEFQISISTNGKNCKRSRAMKEEIKKVLNKIENLENGEENV